MRFRRRLTLLCLLVVALCAGDAHGDDFSISLLDGAQITSAITAIDGEGNLTGPQIDRPVKLQDVISIESTQQAATGVAEKFPVQVRLVGGGRILCRAVVVGDDGLSAQSDGPVLEALPLETIQAIVFRESETAARAIAERTGDKDTVVVQTDDGLKMVAGIFEGISNQKVGLNFNGKSRKIGLGKTTAIILADLKPAAAEGTLTMVETVGGSKVHGVVAGLADNELSVWLSASEKIAIPLASIKRIEVQSENLVYLSMLTPRSVEQKTLFALQRTWQVDASIEGNPISLAYNLAGGNRTVKQFSKGLGMQSWSRIEFANEKQFTRFQATVGIDAETRGRGDCNLEIVSDGITLWSKRISALEDPVEVDIDISGMEAIALVVDPGEEFDLGDHVDWANARFVKTNE